MRAAARLARRLCAVLVLLAAPAAALAEAPVWIVRDADSEIVLFGSLHLLPSGLDWRPKALDEALARADDLWFEAAMDPGVSAEAAARVEAAGRGPVSPLLSERLSPEGRARLQAAAARLRLDLRALEAAPTWRAELVLQLAFYRTAGFTVSDGVEHVLNRAAPRVRRRAFETPEIQAEVLSGASTEAQLVSLEETLRQIESGPAFLGEMAARWAAGDLGPIRDEVRSMRERSPEQYRRLVAARNAAWTGEILKRLSETGRTVMVVGVAHMVGPDGLPARLRAAGARVEGP